MKEFKGTKGSKISIKESEEKKWFNIAVEPKGIIARTFYGDLPPIITRSEARANAVLIVEALHVRQKINCSLAELLEQRDAAIAVLNLIRSNYRLFGRDSSQRMICRLEKEDIDLIEQAIQKAK